MSSGGQSGQLCSDRRIASVPAEVILAPTVHARDITLSAEGDYSG